MFRKTLSQTLHCEIEHLYPHNKSLIGFKRWSDSLRLPFRFLAHRGLHKFMEWWYKRDIYLHQKPLDEQVRIIRELHGSKISDVVSSSEPYVWDGEDHHH